MHRSDKEREKKSQDNRKKVIKQSTDWESSDTGIKLSAESFFQEEERHAKLPKNLLRDL